jgi:glycine hydroxymethyltransferase
MTTSGVRIGTAALATRGFAADEFRQVADVIARALRPGADLGELRGEVAALAGRFPLYEGLEEW